MQFIIVLKTFLKRFFVWLIAIRLHNLLLIFFVQITLFVCLDLSELSDLNFWLLSFASFCSISAGHIINDFYDTETDLINHPFYTKTKNSISKKNKFKYYFIANFTAFCSGFCVSWRVGLFFAGFIFLIWLYSHKIKKHTLFSLLTAALLPTIPVVAILIYFRYFDSTLFMLCFLVYLFLLLTEFVKSLRDVKGDLYCLKKTLVTARGIYFTKSLFSTVASFIFISFVLLFDVLPLYFAPFLWGSFFVIPFLVFLLWQKNRTRYYHIIYLSLKGLILLILISFWFKFYSFL